MSHLCLCFVTCPSSGGMQNLSPSNTFPPSPDVDMAFSIVRPFPLPLTIDTTASFATVFVKASKCFVRVWKSFFPLNFENAAVPRGIGVAGPSRRPRPSTILRVILDESGVSIGEGILSGVLAVAGGMESFDAACLSGRLRAGVLKLGIGMSSMSEACL